MTRPTIPSVDANADHERYPFLALDDANLRFFLNLWENEMGQAWVGTPGLAGVKALEHRMKQVSTWSMRWKLAPGQPYERGYEDVYRPATFDRRAHATEPFLHAYDVTRARPTAAGMTNCCPWTLQPGPTLFDRNLAGWWKVDVAPWTWTEVPDPAGYPDRNWRAGASRWVTSPTLRLLDELIDEGVHGGYSIQESYVGKGRSIFKEWNKRLEAIMLRFGEAPDHIRKPATGSIKMAGRETIGLLNSPNFPTFRPDWHFAVIATERANIFRKVWKVYRREGRLPYAIDTDALWYGSELADPIAACPELFTLGDRPGNLKHKGTVER